MFKRSPRRLPADELQRKLDAIDAQRRESTKRLRIDPPADIETTIAGACGLCGVAHVILDGDETSTFTQPEQTTVCAQCGGTGVLNTVPVQSPPMRCDACRGGTAHPAKTITREVQYTVTRENRQVPRPVLEHRSWRRIGALQPMALDVPGARPVSLWICLECSTGWDQYPSEAFGRGLVKRLLERSGRKFPHGAELSSLRNVTHASRVLDARRRGQPEPEPNLVGWEHVGWEAGRGDAVLVGQGRTFDLRTGLMS